MKRTIRTTIAATALAVPLAVFAQQGPIKIYTIIEQSGGGATAGTNFDNGVKLGFKEIKPRAGSSAARSTSSRSTRRATPASPRRSRRRQSTMARTW